MWLLRHDYHCDRCDYAESVSQMMLFRYVAGEMRAHVFGRDAWCTECATMRMAERLPTPADARAQQEQEQLLNQRIATLELEASGVLARLTVRSRRARVQIARLQSSLDDIGERLAVENARAALLAGRQSGPRCLECGSTELLDGVPVAPETATEIASGLQHPGCGGELLVSLGELHVSLAPGGSLREPTLLDREGMRVDRPAPSAEERRDALERVLERMSRMHSVGDPVELWNFAQPAVKDLLALSTVLAGNGLHQDATNLRYVADLLHRTRKFVVRDGGRYFHPDSKFRPVYEPIPTSLQGCFALEYRVTYGGTKLEQGTAPARERIALCIDTTLLPRSGTQALPPGVMVWSIYRRDGESWQVPAGGLLVAEAPVPRDSTDAALLAQPGTFSHLVVPLLPTLLNRIASQIGEDQANLQVTRDTVEEVLPVMDFLNAGKCSNVGIRHRNAYVPGSRTSGYSYAALYLGSLNSYVHLPRGTIQHEGDDRVWVSMEETAPCAQ